MPLSLRVINSLSVALMFLSMTAVASAQSSTETKKQADDASEEQAIEQLRAMAEAMKKCPESDQTISDFSMVEGKAKEGAFRRRVTAPMNVTWDVEQRQSIRSPKIGLIELTTSASCVPPLPTLPRCKRDDELCWVLFRADSDNFQKNTDYCNKLKPNQYQYEFDFGSKGLEFTRAMRKPENASESLWAAIELGGRKDWTDAVAASCVAEAVRLSLTTRPPEIPETLWEAASKGDTDAIRNIGAMYDSGQGAPQNYAEAIRWYRVAANKGDDLSMNRIGAMYQQGQGVSQSNAEALRWWQMAADKGNAMAMGGVGWTYCIGVEVPLNDKECYFWLSLSASASLSDLESSRDPRPSCLLLPRATCEKTLEEVRKYRDEVAATLSPAKLAEVRARAQKWVETHPKIH